MDYNSYSNDYAHKYSGFSIASMVLGILSILTWCTGILPLGLGGLGVLFAMLTHRSKSGMPSLSKAGLLLSCIGIALGILITLMVVINFIIPMYTDPNFYQEMNEYYKNFYGISLDELMSVYQKGGSL